MRESPFLFFIKIYENMRQTLAMAGILLYNRT